MSGNGNQVPLASNQRGSGPYPRAPTPHDCYHPPGGAGAAFMPAATVTTAPQPLIRVSAAQQPPAPQQQQQDLSKNSMQTHNFVAPQQTQSPQARQQFNNFSFRATQHGSRPSTHPRQQQPYIPATPGGPSVVYQPVMYPSQHINMAQQYQQPRSQPYFPFVPQYINYNSSPGTPFYYTSGSQQLPSAALASNGPGGRNNTTPLVQQGAPANPSAPTAPLSHIPQTQGHMHQNISGTHKKRVSHRLPIIDPVTLQDILLASNNHYESGDSSGRQTPQPETNSIVEDFARRVSEAANQPSASEANMKTNYLSKNVDMSNNMSPPISTLQTQSNAISSINNNIVNYNESKSLGPDVAGESSETPVVSAISDSPVIVPKMCPNKKPLQKNSEQPIIVDTIEKIPSNKSQKPNKKPLVPQMDEVIIIDDDLLPESVSLLTPQSQKIGEQRERSKSEDKQQDVVDKDKACNENGPSPAVVISSVDSLQEVLNSPTSQNSQLELPYKQVLIKPSLSYTPLETQVKTEPLTESIDAIEPRSIETCAVPTANELLPASIEAAASKSIKDLPNKQEVDLNTELASATQAQAKLNNSLKFCVKTDQTESKMKDINLNNKNKDPDTANGNSRETSNSDMDNITEDVNRNENTANPNILDNKKTPKKTASNNSDLKDNEMFKNNTEETDIHNNAILIEDPAMMPEIHKSNLNSMSFARMDFFSPAVMPSTIYMTPEASPVYVTPDESLAPKPLDTQTLFIPKYKYGEDQWSPFNKSGRKYYDLNLLKQIKDDPLSKNKPDVPMLEQCKVMRTMPIMEPLSFNLATARPISDALFPTFVKNTGVSRNSPRDPKKDNRSATTSSKGSVKLSPSPSGSSPHKHNVIHVSLSLRDEVKLNEIENAWKPARFKKGNVPEVDSKIEELYKKFRGILNKLTPQKFDTLLEKVKTLEINNQKRLEGVIDLVFEKAIDEPNFSEAYAAMCNKLSKLKVPADNNPDQGVNFRGLIISKCQNQFVTNKVDDQVLKIEKDLAECTDPGRRKELQLMLEEENRRVRMRSVGNVRFIGELYKLKMLTSRIMVYCMTYLIEKLEEEKLECLCKLLTTIGEQFESEAKDNLDGIFKKMQSEIVDRKNSHISSRVRFMIQDVIELRKRHWVAKSVVDLQPKMMDQIQKEAEQQHRQTELLNASMGGSYRRDEGGRGKRGDSRRQGQNSFMDNSNNWKSTRNYSVDTSKFKAVSNPTSKIENIKLAPQSHKSQWTHGSSTKSVNTNNSPVINLTTTTNKYSALENAQTDPATLRGNKDITPGYHSKGASIERSTFNSRGDYSPSGGNRSGSMNVGPGVNTQSTSAPPAPELLIPAPVVAPVRTEEPALETEPLPQEPLTEQQEKLVKSIIDLCLLTPDDNEMVAEFKQRFAPQHHAGIVTKILNVALEKPAIKIAMIAKSVLHLVSTNTISSDNFAKGLKEIFDIAPDLYIDIPRLYDYICMFVVPQLERKHTTLAQIFADAQSVISSNQGHLLLKVLIKDLKLSMGPSFVKSKWKESGLHLSQWMTADQITRFVEENKFEFLEGAVISSEVVMKVPTPIETHSKLLQLMTSDETCDCIHGWIQDNLGETANDDWFIRVLLQVVYEYALFGNEGRGIPQFNPDRMSKYTELITVYGKLTPAREVNCLFGIQQLIHQLEHPQGVTLEIFQYLHEQYIISVEGFIMWEESDLEPEGKGVMMKALTSFFTNIKEVDNEEDSCSED